ncbi:MAG: hypothetical protein HC802_01925 [Caldilineaceae bacterium]|nr:hypothetical protein [Caldilineaceae bacterium]
MNNPTSPDPFDFAKEVEEAVNLLQRSLHELPSPLSDLVLAEKASASPPVRIGVVLAFGVGEPDTLTLREQRIYLAVALEILYIALQVHKLLFIGAEDGDDGPDKSLVGSTILAGDYCFSRSAQLAAQTNSPRAVDIFAGALRDVSEVHLRRMFSQSSPAVGSNAQEGDLVAADDADDNQLLFRSGIRAVGVLAGHGDQQTAAALACGADLAAALQTIPGSAASLTSLRFTEEVKKLTQPQQLRWRQLVEWLATPHLPTK